MATTTTNSTSWVTGTAIRLFLHPLCRSGGSLRNKIKSGRGEGRVGRRVENKIERSPSLTLTNKTRTILWNSRTKNHGDHLSEGGRIKSLNAAKVENGRWIRDGGGEGRNIRGRGTVQTPVPVNSPGQTATATCHRRPGKLKIQKKVRADAKASQTGRLMHRGGGGIDGDDPRTTERRDVASNPEDKEGEGRETKFCRSRSLNP